MLENIDRELGHVSDVVKQITLSKAALWLAPEDPNHKETTINKGLHKPGCMHSPPAMLIQKRKHRCSDGYHSSIW
jgi:hypothetical protein